ncbi:MULTISPECIES: UDP-glucose 4-epimerase GalE [unclassified Herbaspirillum]|uniref:UDP-glucose 4-epimerase GalE n=1 Tax=unclassified Herbaspirillum TaxID=2624150 RepID=UPI00114F569B|nr:MULTISPECIES: UDP-glucose 4-epimerase GalE [unclassified Herbaspirillum]MBB5390107.1 UDP-glucose 4-epimerase [Herbaspirillum sp. SJZ102]TQK09394.1 UDP-galactose 4-epimerase [Herbaspirillum sp. SJZ130]TQK13919.1 UDP-galactose 4-epimerase [Herbaspirillum sp. SJZ106]
MNILVTGGAGYIGSHTCVELLKAGHEVVVFDNFCNSSPEAVARVQKIAGKSVSLVKGDVRNREQLESVLREFKCEAVIHFAGLKAVGESVEQPLMYYDNNVLGTVRLLEAMEATGVKTIVFSSSATVYAPPQYLPLDEDHPLAASSPYGRSKMMVEDILRDCYRAHPDWKIALLRYFNPVGAHESGLIGEDPDGIPNNLMPFVAQVAIGRRERLNIWGGDYPTPDGTGVRDFIHVVDLATGHLAALQTLTEPQCFAINLGTGTGHSVLDVVKAYEKACGKTLPYIIAERRPGDIAEYYANPAAAKRKLGWEAQRGLDAICADSWRWQQMNPNGFKP